MKLDPQTTIADLLRALPSSALVFEKLGIHPTNKENTSLQQVCADRGIDLAEFLRELDEIDWEKESLGGQDSHFY